MALTNGNITLRALEPSDVELLYQWENDSEVWRVSNTRTPLSKFALANYIKSADRDIWESKEMRLLIETSQGKPVGTVELFDFDPYHSRVGVGIMIYNTADRKKGIASEALEIVADYAQNELGIAQFYANVSENNIPSLQLFQKLGFVVAGIKKNWLKTPIGWENEHLLQKFL
ncbi:MAG: GNAT family N-acetyltransferase [Prolixibacteraceae bacterium]|jgi:diamine N-acetyltransferase|nr:GNAT family N-acetyltransferase [Prolixibacteraceae bacterium]